MKLSDFVDEHSKLMMAIHAGNGACDKDLMEFITRSNIAIEAYVSFSSRLESLQRGWKENTDVLCQLRDQISAYRAKERKNEV